MKRTASLKRTPLARRTPLTARPKRRTSDPARDAWKTPTVGACGCGCGKVGRLERHHVVELQAIKREGRMDLAYDPRNALGLHPACHQRHTLAVKRVSIDALPDEALAFAVDLLGEERAALYIARYYARGPA